MGSPVPKQTPDHAHHGAETLVATHLPTRRGAFLVDTNEHTRARAQSFERHSLHTGPPHHGVREPAAFRRVNQCGPRIACFAAEGSWLSRRREAGPTNWV